MNQQRAHLLSHMQFACKCTFKTTCGMLPVCVCNAVLAVQKNQACSYTCRITDHQSLLTQAV